MPLVEVPTNIMSNQTIADNILFMQDIVARLGRKIVSWEEDLSRTPSDQRQAERLLLAQLKLSEVLCRSKSPEEAAVNGLDIFVEYTDYDAGGVYVYQENELHLVAHRGLSEKFIEEVMGFSSSAIQAQIVRDAPYFGPYPPHSDVINQTRKDEGLVDFACLPLTYGNVIIGALNLGSHYPVSIDPKNKAAIVTAASHLGEVLGRIETMRELHEQRLQFYALTMASDEAVAIFNEGRVIRANRAFCEMLGMEEEKVIGLKKPDIVHPEDLDIYFKHKEAGLLSTTTSLRIKTLDGNYKSIMVKFKDLKKLNGYEDCVVLLAHEWQPRKH